MIDIFNYNYIDYYKNKNNYNILKESVHLKFIKHIKTQNELLRSSLVRG